MGLPSDLCGVESLRHGRGGNSGNLMCARFAWVYVCVYRIGFPATLLFSVLLPLTSPPKQTDLFDGRLRAAARQHPPTFALRVRSSFCGSAGGETRGPDHPGLSSEGAALMWQQHMRRATATVSAQTHSQIAVLLPPVRRRRSRGESEPPSLVPDGARLESRGLTVTLGERKPAQPNHISINQSSSKVNRGLIREQC